MLKIVDRTKPLVPKPKIATEAVKSPEVVAPIKRSILEQYTEMAEAIKARKKPAWSEKDAIKPTKPAPVVVEKKSFLEIANELKAKRLAVKKDITHIPVQPKKSFICKNKELVEFEVVPSNHAIEQFIKRYVYLEPYIKTLRHSQIIEYMRDLFNNCNRISSKNYQTRNRKRKDSASALVLGDSKFAFIVNPEARLIMTFELTGTLRYLNKTLSNVNKEAYDSGDYSRLQVLNSPHKKNGNADNQC